MVFGSVMRRHYNNPSLRRSFRRAAGKLAVAGGHATGKFLKRKLDGLGKKSNSRKSKKPVKKPRPAGEQVSHSSLSSSTIKIKSANKPRLNKRQKIMGTWTYQQCQSGYYVSQEGQQAMYITGAVNSLQQRVTSSGASFAYYQNDVGLQQLNPYLTNTGSAKLASIVTPLEDRFIVKGVTIDMEVTNFEPVGVFCDVYICKVKKVCNQGMISTIDSGLMNEAFGLSSTTPAVAGYGNHFAPGVKPNDSNLFKEFFKIEAVRSLEMTAGATERIHIDIELDKLVKTDDVNASIVTGNVFDSSTYVTFIVHRGSLVFNTTTNLVSYGPTKIGIVSLFKYRCCAVGGNADRLSSNIFSTANLETTGGLGLRVLNEVDQSSVTNIL